MLSEARAYYQQRVSRAAGEAQRFLDLLAEYRRAPELYRDRVWLQTLERVLARSRVVIVDNRPGEKPTRLLIVDQSPE